MKIYTKVVFDLHTLEVVEEDSFDYVGRVAECKGGSGGGGGGSGKVDYPDYMETDHGAWLDDLDTLINAASNPFTGVSAYDPSTSITEGDDAICAFNTLVDALDNVNDWTTAVAAVVAYADASVLDTVTLATPTPAVQAELDDDVNAFADELDEQIDTTVYPRYELGMRDINAVQSSTFTAGRALIENSRDKQVAKHASTLRVAAYMQRDKILADNIDRKNELNVRLETGRREYILRSTDRALSDLISRVDFERHVATLTADFKRIEIVAKSEEDKQNLAIDEAEATFPLEIYQYGANMMASIGGGAVGTTAKQPTQLQSALSGALMGAAAGAMIPGAGLVGAAVGAVAGGAAGLLGLW